jgi:hypothetical protein
MFSTYRPFAAISAVLFGFALFPGDAAALSCHDLDGAVLTTFDFQIPLGFLGTMTAQDSIENPNSLSGNPASASSVQNPTGTYGLIARDPLTTTPLVISKYYTAPPGGAYKFHFVAYLTANTTDYPYPLGATLENVNNCAIPPDEFVATHYEVVYDYIFADEFGQ